MAELQTRGESGQIITAMIAVQTDLEPLKANQKGNHDAKFADLHQVMKTLQPHLTKNKLAVIQIPVSSASGSCSVLTRIIHEDGSEVSSTITIPMQRQNDPQAYGAAMTYGRRYALLCMFGMVTADDDAASATMTLEKLLREISHCTTREELTRTKEEHIQKGAFSDKFWSTVYTILVSKNMMLCLRANQRKTDM